MFVQPKSVLISLVLLINLAVPPVVTAESLRVFVSVPPMKTFVEKVGGKQVNVSSLVQPGYNPHTYDPPLQLVRALSDADLYIHTGTSFDHAWMARIRATNPDMHVVDVRSGIELVNLNHHDGDGTHEMDPHVWTSPPVAKQIADTIRDQLVQMDSTHAPEFERNYLAFADELDTLDAEIRVLLAPLTHRKFMVFHPGWGYFAETYNLVQIPIEHEGKSPGARTLATLIDQAREENIRTIFVQPQFDRRMANQIARAIDGVLIEVDPLASDYTQNLRSVAGQFAQAMQP